MRIDQLHARTMRVANLGDLAGFIFLAVEFRQHSERLAVEARGQGK